MYSDVYALDPAQHAVNNQLVLAALTCLLNI